MQQQPKPSTSQPSGNQPSSSQSSSSSQSAGQSAPGTAPIASHTEAAALGPGKGPSYENRWDAYGGLAFANGQAGQNLPKRFNMGGGEGQFTWWIPVISITVSGSPPTSATARAPRPSCRTRPTTVRWLFIQPTLAARSGADRATAMWPSTTTASSARYTATSTGPSRRTRSAPARSQPARSHRTSGQYRALLQPRVSVGSYWRQHRLQSGTEVRDPPLARPHLRALRHGDTRVLRDFARSALSRRPITKRREQGSEKPG